MDRGESWDCKNSKQEWRLAGAESSNANGKTNMAEATAEVSGLWQQDMLQAIIPSTS